MNLKLVVAIAGVVLWPVYGNAQLPTAEDYQRVTSIIGTDNTKRQAWCELQKNDCELGAAADRGAAGEKKVYELLARGNQLEQVIPEVAELQRRYAESQPPAGAERAKYERQIQAAHEAMIKLCPKSYRTINRWCSYRLPGE